MTALLVLLKASVILLLTAFALVIAARRASAATRHFICALAVVALLMLPILVVALPGWEITYLSATPQAAVHTVTALTSAEGRLLPNDRGRSAAPPVIRASGDVPADDSQAVEEHPVLLWQSWPALAVLVYVAGALLLIGRLAADRAAARRLVSAAIEPSDDRWEQLRDACATKLDLTRPVPLLRNPQRATPLTIGIRRPVIVIPAMADQWSDETRRVVLLHELAHVARRDCLAQTAAALMCAVYWVHPGSWWLARRLRIERELACDDLVLSNGANARDYADVLLELAYSVRPEPSPAFAVGMAAPTTQLESRLLAIVDAARDRKAPTRRTCVLALMVGALLLLPLARATTASAQSTAAAARQADDSGRYDLGADHYRRFLSVEYWRHAAAYGLSRLADQLNYLAEMRQLGYSMADPNVLFSLRQHGVTPYYVRSLQAVGLQKLSTDDLLTAVSHGVSASFVREMRELGFTPLDVETLTRLRSHGISPDYVRETRAFGYRWSIDELQTARSHGIDEEYLDEMAAVGYRQLPLDDLTRLRNHGVEPSFVSGLQTLGYAPLTLGELANLRSHGVTLRRIREANADAGRTLTVDELTTLASHGWKRSH